MRKCLKLVVALVVLYSATALAAPATMEEMKSTIDALKTKLEAQQSRLDQIETRVAQDMRLEMAKVARELAADAAKQSATPAWLDNLTFSGDFRLRYRNDCADDLDDTRRSKDRNRVQFRLRFGFIKTWLDEQLTVGFRLASGEEEDAPYWDDDPRVTDQTFTGLFSRKSIWIDRAYAIYKPKALPGLVVAGGKLGIPFVHTDMIWDEDINAEGFWAQYSRAFGPVEPFVNGGYFIAYENLTGDSWTGGTDDFYDTILMFYQVGMNWKITKDVKWTFAASYYDFDHTHAAIQVVAPSDPDYYGPQSLAYEMINFTNKVEFKLFKLPFEAYVDYVHNCENRMSVENDENMDDAIAVGIKVGKNEKKGDWSVGYKYAYIEAFATPFFFNDVDFNGTNTRGHVIRATYNLTDFLTVGGSIFMLQNISDSATLGETSGAEEVTSIVDLTWCF